MHIYKFRILLEDNDQFFREIDIKANQTFEQFHQILNASAGFDGSEMASFYICDSKWSKQQEISICDMAFEEEERQNPPDDDEDEKPANQRKPILTMCKTKLKDVIIDPHQRIIYIYDFLKMHTFYLELYKIKTSEAGVEYPSIVKSVGQIHFPPQHLNPEEDDDETPEEIDPLKDDEEEIGGGEEMLDGLYDDTLIN